ncbi:MAG: hypothetical protein ACREOJ_14220 [Gemmatimonadaceae bacterium]
MTSEDVKAIVARELATWRPPVVEPGTTIGIPWTPERYRPEIERLRAALVTPYEQRFALHETDDPEPRRVEGQAVYWVVASTGDMYLWYDEATDEFGVGEPSREGALPRSIGLRGDIVGSFCAW